MSLGIGVHSKVAFWNTTGATPAVNSSASGSTFVAIVSCDGTTAPSSISDTVGGVATGNIYVLKSTAHYNGSSDTVFVYACASGVGGASHVLTANWAASTICSVFFVELTGGASYDTSTTANNTTSMTSSSVSPSANGALVLMAFGSKLTSVSGAGVSGPGVFGDAIVETSDNVAGIWGYQTGVSSGAATSLTITGVSNNDNGFSVLSFVPGGAGALTGLGASVTTGEAQTGAASALRALAVSATAGAAQPQGAGAVTARGIASSTGTAAISGPNAGATGFLGVSSTANAQQPATPITQPIAALGISATRASVTITGTGAITARGASQSTGIGRATATGILEALGLASSSGGAQPAGGAPISGIGISASAAITHGTPLGAGATSAVGITGSGARIALSGAGALSLLGVSGSNGRADLSGAGSIQVRGASVSAGITQPYGSAQISAFGAAITNGLVNLLSLPPGTLSMLGVSMSAGLVAGFIGTPVKVGRITFTITENQISLGIAQNSSSLAVLGNQTSLQVIQ